MAPTIVPTVTPTMVPNAVPQLAPHAIRHVAHGGACATARSGARVLPHHRACHGAHIASPIVALGVVGPNMACGEVLVGCHPTPITLTGGASAPPPCIDIDALFTFLEQEVPRLQ